MGSSAQDTFPVLGGLGRTNTGKVPSKVGRLKLLSHKSSWWGSSDLAYISTAPLIKRATVRPLCFFYPPTWYTSSIPRTTMSTKTYLSTVLPRNEDEWNDWTVQYKVSGSTIHDATLTSASTIGEGQYLLLQVLWTSHGTRRLNLEQYKLDTWKQEADKLLATFKSWADYRKSFPNGPIREGTFALAKRYQSQAAASREEVFQSNVAISPVANRTRSRMGNLEKKLREARLETPTKSTGKLLDSSEVEDTPDTGDSPFYSPGPGEIAHLMYPQTKDEQIVNTALVDFLNALTMHFPQASDWTLHRKSFKATFQHAAFEARTDGYLEDGRSPERARALVEVKPMLRRRKRNPICMQEAAQMVAWIKSDPDLTGALNLTGR